MTDNEKMMLPLKILSDLSLNAGTIDIEEPMKDESEGGQRVYKRGSRRSRKCRLHRNKWNYHSVQLGKEVGIIGS